MANTLTTTYPSTASVGVLSLRGQEAQSYRDDTLTVTPIMVSNDSVFGAEIAGIVWDEILPPEQIKQVSLVRSPHQDSYLSVCPPKAREIAGQICRAHLS